MISIHVRLNQIFASRHAANMKNAKTASGEKFPNLKIKSVHIIVTVLTLLLTPHTLYATMTQGKSIRPKRQIVEQNRIRPRRSAPGPLFFPESISNQKNSVVSPPIFQIIIRILFEKMRCERNGVERAYTRKIWKMPLPFRNFSSASPYSIFYRFLEK